MNIKNNEPPSEKEYYLRNKQKILKDFNKLIKIAKKIVGSRFDAATVEGIAQQAKQELENLLARVPYVGGKKAPFTSLMLQSAETLAFYRSCEHLGLSPYELGQIIYEICEIGAESLPWIKKKIMRKLIFSKKMKNYWRKWSNESEKREYPENWVSHFIDGDNKSLAYGFDFTECGCLKLLQKEGAKEILPYVCLCDYARMRALGIGFKRTTTLVAGADKCDFRFIRNYQTPRGWPPQSLEENKEFNLRLKG